MVDPQLTYRPRLETKWCILHDAHTLPNLLRPIEWLKVQGRVNGLLSIGFHFVVFEDGELVACRPMPAQGSHCRGFNHNSVGVCLIGGLRHRLGEDGEQIDVHCDTFTPAQKDKVRALMVYLEAHYPGIRLRGHTEMGRHAETHRGFPCPALNMDELRACP